MARKSSTNKNNGAALRALRDARAVADPKVEAQQHENAFLVNVGAAQAELRWLVEHQAWRTLGFESPVEWWETRIRPKFVELELRPAPAVAQQIMQAVEAHERGLPAAQRRSKKELARLALASDWTGRGRNQDRDLRRAAAGADLGRADIVDAELVDDHKPAGVPDPRPTGLDGSTTPPVDPSTQAALAIVDGSARVEAGVGRLPDAGTQTAADPLVASAAVPEQIGDVEGSTLPVDPSTQNHPPAAAGEAPVVSAPSAGAGAQPSVPLGEAGMGDETAGGLLASGPSAVDLEDDEEPPIASPEELKNLIDEWLGVLDRRIEYATLAPQYDEDSLLDLELQVEGFARTVGLLRRWWKEEQA